jgi:hypothetical protein
METEKQTENKCTVFSLLADSIQEFLVPEYRVNFLKFPLFNSVLSVLIQCFSHDVIPFKHILVCSGVPRGGGVQTPNKIPKF